MRDLYLLHPTKTQVIAKVAASNCGVCQCIEAIQTLPEHLESFRGILDPPVLDGMILMAY